MDIIKGHVFNVSDGESFDIKVTHTHAKNKIRYKFQERVHIANLDELNLPAKEGKREWIDLYNHLINKKVVVHIESRNAYGRLVGKVKIIK
jgi:hypothetical protein